MIRHLRALRKFIFFIFYAFFYISYSFIGRLIIRTPTGRRRFHAETVTMVTRGACTLLGIRRNYINPPPADKNFLFVGNHLGFLDVLVLSSFRPTLFVTSVEMRETPFLGLLCEMGGCHFVERRSRAGLMNEIGEIRKTLKDGFSVAIYPEGTSGDGSRILPLKKSLLMAGVASGVTLKIMVINYRKINGEKLTDQWRNYVCWYGDLYFFPALWRLFTLESIDVDLAFYDEMQIHESDDRREIAERIQGIFEKNFEKVPFPQ